jgi:hypothetical protein
MATIAALHRDVSCALDRALGMMREGDLAGAELELRRALSLRRALLAQEATSLAALEASLAE